MFQLRAFFWKWLLSVKVGLEVYVTFLVISPLQHRRVDGNAASDICVYLYSDLCCIGLLCAVVFVKVVTLPSIQFTQEITATLYILFSFFFYLFLLFSEI